MKIADHKVAIRNGGIAFPPMNDLTSMCQTCHNRKTRDDVHGVKGYDLDGNPLDETTGWDGGGDNHWKGEARDRLRETKTDLVSKSGSGDDLWV
jgi:hypothetical protein